MELTKKFSDIGARVKVQEGGIFRDRNSDIQLNILRDKEGEYFDIQLRDPDNINLKILDTQKKDKHLLLMAETPKQKMKYLCGYDERHFFTCAIPETKVSTVLQAKQALKPASLINTELKTKVKKKDLHKRSRRTKRGNIRRQGEFNFIPLPGFNPPPGSLTVVYRDEPMSRGGNPHMAEYLYREGGTAVYVNSKYPEGLTEKEYRDLLKTNKEAKNYIWENRTRNPDAYAKGRIRHVDHRTVDLKNVWHRVEINTEDKASFAKTVAFLD